jgi:hypothetical protein
MRKAVNQQPRSKGLNLIHKFDTHIPATPSAAGLSRQMVDGLGNHSILNLTHYAVYAPVGRAAGWQKIPGTPCRSRRERKIYYEVQ